MRHRFGEWVIVVSRPIPVLAEASVLFAGLSGMPASRFLLLSTLSNLGISAVYAAVGAFSASTNSFLFLKIPNDYAVSNERNTLSRLVPFSNLKAYGGADLQELFNRLITAKRHSEKYGIKSVEFYPRILTRGGHLRSLLSSIPPHQQEEIQALL